MKKSTPPATPTEASKAIASLVEAGSSLAAIAVALVVDVQSIRRWAAGTHEPIAGNKQRLLALAEKVAEKAKAAKKKI